MFDDSVYSVVQGVIEFTSAINPYHRDVRLMMWASGSNIYEYSVMGVKDIAVSGNSLRINVNDDEEIIITIRPVLNIKHEASDKT
ncbi:hypothetical protein B9G39_29030 [Zooshikella ganghwensis]|uniref:Uncharacterized protein n=1 Tax=Zooshikella ganghwensis TaxID=202772 RepID=A0A4P9VE29_9GAMM|nr:hypothetical protein B9G39_29030 [Zooshikella ganghwensis]